MKLTPVIFAAVCAAAFLSVPASATDINQLCLDTVAADNAAAGVTLDADGQAGMAAGCSCLGAKADADAAIADNVVMIAAMAAADRQASMTEATAAAVGECFPQPDAAE